MVRPKAPETTPESVRLFAATVMFLAAGSAMAPESVRLLVPTKLRSWVSVSALATVRPAAAASSEPPLMVIAPVPAPVLEARESVPALTATPPEKAAPRLAV